MVQYCITQTSTNIRNSEPGTAYIQPNSTTLSGRRRVRSWSQTCSELKCGVAEIARVDNAAVDKSARRSRGGHRESGQRSTKKQGWTTREWTRRHEETGVDNAGVDNAGVAKHEQRGGMSRNHTEERQQLNAPVTRMHLR